MIMHGEGTKISVRGEGIEKVLKVLMTIDATTAVVVEAPHNDIPSIKCVANLTRLSDLILSDNKIASLSGIESLSNLRRLELSANEITNFDEVLSLRRLEILDLSYNSITSFDSLTKLKFACRGLRVLIVHGNPGSTCKSTLSRLVGFNSLTNISVGVTATSERHYLILANPQLNTIDGKPVHNTELEQASFLNPWDFFQIHEKTNGVTVQHPDLTVISRLNSKVSRLESELASSRAHIAKYESEKREYADYVSLNVQKLTEYIGRTKQERAAERLHASTSQAALDHQVRELRLECERLRDLLSNTQNDYRKETMEVHEMQEQKSVHIHDLESKLKTAVDRLKSLEIETTRLRIQNDAKDNDIGELKRDSRHLSHCISELLSICTSSVDQRRIIIGTMENVRPAIQALSDDIAVCIAAMERCKIEHRKREEELVLRLEESEAALANSQNRLQALRDEYVMSVAAIDESLRKKVSKHELALTKLHALYESEKSTRSELEATITGFAKRETEWEETLQRTKEETQLTIRTIEHERLNERLALTAEMEGKLESCQRKLEAREKDLVEMTETLDRMRTSLRVKEEVSGDLASQVRDLRSQVASLEDEENSASSAERECFKRQLGENERETMYFKRQLEDAESTIQQKEQLVQYVSSEIGSIKEAYEGRLSSLEAAHDSELSKMKQKLGDAASALLQLDRTVKEKENENECLRLKLDDAMHEKAKLEKLNSQKISQIKCILGDVLS